MTDYKILVPARDRGMLALAELGMYVAGCSEAFNDIDPNTITNWDYITAVPVELSLTSESRTALMKANPKCRFLVTEVTKDRVNKMVEEYGYTELYANYKAGTIPMDKDADRPAKIKVLNKEEPKVDEMGECTWSSDPDLANVPAAEDYIVYDDVVFTAGEVRAALDMFLGVVHFRNVFNAFFGE